MPFAPVPAPIPAYWDWPYNVAVPQWYAKGKSEQQQVLQMACLLDKLQAYANDIASDNNALKSIVQQIIDAFEKFMQSGFDDYYKQQVAQWIGENLQKIVDAMTVSTVYFGLTDDGYFTAYYPLSWKTVQFDTVMDYSSQYYGCLSLFY